MIAPGSTLDQWEQCLGHWYPALDVVKYHGNGAPGYTSDNVMTFEPIGSESHRAELREHARHNGFNVVLSTLSYWERDTAAQKEDR